MNFKKNLEIKKNIQILLTEYIDDGMEDNYNQLIKIISNLNIDENLNELKAILQLINAFYGNHHRSPDFFNRIDKVVLHYKYNIQQLLSNKENYGICKFNLRLLLLLHEEKVISIEDYPYQSKLFKYFFYEKFGFNLSQISKEIGEEFDQETFNKNRKIGENHSYICTLIRNDSIKEFVKYTNKTNYSLSSTIAQSIFETNEYLRGRSDITLIQYAAFFGSIQIFQYLKMNGIELTHFLWPFAIHSNNPEIIHILEENDVPITNLVSYVGHGFLAQVIKVKASNEIILNDLKKLLIEAIKCHHNNIFEYMQYDFNIEKYTNRSEEDNNENTIFIFDTIKKKYGKKDNNKQITFNDIQSLYPNIFESYNYAYFPEDIDDNLLFCYLVAYGYTSLVELFLEEKVIDINSIVILKKNI